MNTYGKKFRISIFGESHGELIGVVMDDVPAGIQLSEADFMEELSHTFIARYYLHLSVSCLVYQLF